jgi:hypothetical protein
LSLYIFWRAKHVWRDTLTCPLASEFFWHHNLKRRNSMSSPEDRLRELPLQWRFEPHPATEFILRDIDPGIRARVVAARLDAIAKVHGNIADIHRNYADAANNISKILTGKAGK